MPLFAGSTPEDQLASAVEASAASWHEVKHLAWIDVLDSDTRPSVLIDLNLVNVQNSTWGRVYSNPAFLALSPSETALSFDSKGGKFVFSGSLQLRDWAFGPASTGPDATPSILEDGWLMTRTTVRGRWRLIQGLRPNSFIEPATDHGRLSQPIPVPGAADGLSSPFSPGNARSPSVGMEMSRSISEARSPRTNPIDEIHRHPMLRSADWSKSTLGPPETWPRWMSQVVANILPDPDPHMIFWNDRSILYNDAVIPLISSKHPSALGCDAAVALEELWQSFGPIVETVRSTQRVRKVDAMSLPLDRRGYLEETHWTFTLMPIINADGECVGVMDRLSEVTKSVLASRRLEQINAIAEKTGEADTLDELWGKVIEVVGLQPIDSPYALLYSISDQRGTIPKVSAQTGHPQGVRCRLKAHVGVDLATMPQFGDFDLADPNHSLARLCSTALMEGKIQVPKTSEDDLPEDLQVTIADRGFGDTVNALVVVPIKLGDEAVAVLIKALNPRRPVDSDYMTFAKLMSRRLHDSFSRVFSPSDERKFRAEVEQAAMEHANLTQELLLRTRRAEDEAASFIKLAENAPIGMYMYDPQGFPIYINDFYFEMTGLERESFTQFSWLQSVHREDHEYLMQQYSLLYDEKQPVTFEFRMSKPYMSTAQDGTQTTGQSWALASAFPQMDDSEQVVNIIGWQIDISSQKWAESLQKDRLKDALESRAQAHRFIDMVSHECRNPLSAILQSADGILTSLGSFGESARSQQAGLHDVIETVQDSAQTIVLCAQHQKRIVDDILTVSKLDGNHLIITPDRADPLALVQHVLKMYEAELDSDSIASETSILSGYKTLGIDYVLLDPSRTLQVLINLVTNAIKFTAPSKRRKITISIDASRRRPTTGINNTTFVPERTAKLSPNASHPEWSTGKDLYISFAVQDTGRGMTAAEVNKLFERFAQASPRTHIKYGGSGLGLFISRQLTELQGGQIGVSSKLGAGSTFAFYILARTSADPAKAALTPVYTPGPASNTSDSHNAAYPFPQVPGAAATQGPPEIGTFTTTGIPGTSTPTQASLAQTPKPTSKPFDPNDLSNQNIHILIVEDNLINQKVMAKQLRNLGCSVSVANHGLEALEFIKRSVFAVFPPCVCGDDDHPLDVVLMDIEMPVMDGMTCVKEIRGMERRGEINGHVPVIAVTANARDAQQQDAVKEGMDQVVTKPFRIPELVPKMMGLVKRARGD